MISPSTANSVPSSNAWGSKPRAFHVGGRRGDAGGIVGTEPLDHRPLADLGGRGVLGGHGPRGGAGDGRRAAADAVGDHRQAAGRGQRDLVATADDLHRHQRQAVVGEGEPGRVQDA
jgi:hypothetical protein